MARFPNKTHMKKRSSFWQKPWTNPVANFPFDKLFSNITIPVLKPLFSIQNIKKRFFMARFPTKTPMRKMETFCQKSWTNPFENSRFFLLFFPIYYSRLKRILLYSEYKKMTFCGYISHKSACEKKGDFLTKPLD